MEFFHTQCSLCACSIIDPGAAVFLKFEPSQEPRQARRKLCVVDTQGQQPWSGVRTVCWDCVRTLGKAALKEGLIA